MLSSFPPRNLSPELYQLDYLVALSSLGRQLVPFLRKLGLNCTEPTKNPAQGTVSTLIFFENVYLELLCFDESGNLAQFDMNGEFNFLARVNWLETGASPFGFGLSYPATNYDNFETATVKEAETDKISIFSANPEEPICYVVPNYVAIGNRLDRVFATVEQIAPQTMGMRQLTHVKLRVLSERVLASDPGEETSPKDRASLTAPLANLVAQNFLEIEYGKHPLLELTFDHGNQQGFLDLRPLISIVLRY